MSEPGVRLAVVLADTPDSAPVAPVAAPPADDVVVVEAQLRWGDMDVNRHINNVQVARLFEEGRVRAFSRWFRGRGEQVHLLVARQDIEFRAPILYTEEPVSVAMAITRLGTSSYTIGAAITAADGVLSALAGTTMVVIDPESGRPIPIPDGVRAVLSAYQGEVPALRPAR
ncbi:acyl-CoA thioesterase [Gordonia desulfuricans]|uniref:Acyl-CoA thioesterase n=1 Tax=Gordonia desulfuricans TaxID=89051 RepID=A0A7K3LL75_9ACTN|nr:thioesterase [Gordonia sp. NB41Y]NDK89002.1 acyl-CoA thioesterase [Gordonia desulfuricans]